ncbi:hypothetical protein [Polaromonas naphthalenivorans]|uniref:Uncharacterized protein n=1 Tax=Polaromonas naphthalenivorans (strain CJ2) TaxID=365044 RepID=A1VIX8_POLNA|nr:hypothetical protein [Polaromonas naphthalenivorans]ABM35606.1 hypothetical protein Pnap_0283 [Polaromonas naphthalenivorans CJ2]MBH2009502.1 hypothetical protein [Xanthomonadaceae bacterium]
MPALVADVCWYFARTALGVSRFQDENVPADAHAFTLNQRFAFMPAGIVCPFVKYQAAIGLWFLSLAGHHCRCAGRVWRRTANLFLFALYQLG